MQLEPRAGSRTSRGSRWSRPSWAPLLVIGILGGISVFDSSRRESATGERQQIAALQAQEELERLRDVPYAELALDPVRVLETFGRPGEPPPG